MTEPSQHWHALRPEDAVNAVDSDAHGGLSEQEARRRFAQAGPNELPEPPRRSLLSVFVSQFKSPLIYLLLASAGIALALGHVSDAAVIATVVLLNALIGAFQEGRAERSLQALRKLAAHPARVVREGGERVIESREVVQGDVLLLEAGDAVGADARLLDGAALQIAEAALTGESQPVSKHLLPLSFDTPLADRRNMLYAGTHVAAGRARAVVVATGLQTEIGHIASLAEAAEAPQTPLERRIDQFGRALMFAALAMFAAVIGIGLLRKVPIAEIVMIGISQVVGMIPEGLPVAMTVALALGVQRMARRGGIVRRLAAVETLGSTTVICTDKTGTLTRNEMVVTAIALPDGRRLTVTGAGYEPTGNFLEDHRALDPADPDLQGLLEAAALCSDAQLQGPEESEPRWKPIGDPTEVALLTAAIKAGVIPSQLKERLPRSAEIPFDAAAKMMAVQVETPQGPRVILKGAPEEILQLCRASRQGGRAVELNEAGLRAIHGAVEALAGQALRLLAVAVVDGAHLDASARFAPLKGQAVLLGLVGQLDPPRPEVKDAVLRCKQAGIRPVMVTGDHRATATAIARQLGIAGDSDGVVEGRELEQLTEAQLAQRLDTLAVFARVHPAQKLRIVAAYQARGEVVAMTGDGVNDAPALMRANVGVAMGRSGTEVAKEAAKIVITDDNFATIVAAVEEGRVVYRNLKKLVLYLFSTSVAEVGVLLSALILGYPPPLAAVQILWINLVTEGTVTINLIMEPAEGDEMREKPVASSEPLLDRALLSRMAFMTPTIMACVLGWFITRLSAGVPFDQVQTETFTVLAVCQWFNVLNCRSERRSAFSLSLLRNKWLIGALVVSNLLHAAVIFLPPLNRVFHTVPIGLGQVLAIGAVASTVLWVEELRKWVTGRRSRRRPAHARARPRPLHLR